MILATHGIIRSIASFTGLLDLYPSAAAAYSLRKLRAAYTGSAIMVRRSSDNTEQNIGFNATGNLDTAALTTFCSGTNGFVTTWYDQSGNSNNALQTTAANQPQIVISGSVIFINSKPSLLFDGVNDGLNLTSSISGNAPSSQFLVQKLISSVGFMGFCGPGSGGANTIYGPSVFPKYGNTMFMRWQQGYIATTGESSTAQLILSGIALSTNGKYYKNNSLQSSSFTSSPLTNNFSQLGYGNDYSNAYAQEAIIYSSDKDSIVSGINTNINSYYAIY